MKAEQLIKKEILINMLNSKDILLYEDCTCIQIIENYFSSSTDIENNIDLFFDDLYQEYSIVSEFKEYFRVNGTQIALPVPFQLWSRYYEVVFYCQKLRDESYVAYPYYYGGGKHGEPSLENWMDKAIFIKHRQIIKPIDQYALIDSEEYF